MFRTAAPCYGGVPRGEIIPSLLQCNPRTCRSVRRGGKCSPVPKKTIHDAWISRLPGPFRISLADIFKTWKIRFPIPFHRHARRRTCHASGAAPGGYPGGQPAHGRGDVWDWRLRGMLHIQRNALPPRPGTRAIRGTNSKDHGQSTQFHRRKMHRLPSM